MLHKEKDLSQDELASPLKTSASIISRYKRDEMSSGGGIVVGYLLAKNNDALIHELANHKRCATK